MSGAQKGIKIGAICLAVFIILNIFSAILYGLSFVGGFVFFASDDNNSVNFNEFYNGVTSIDIDVVSSNIEIKVGDSFRVEANNVNDKFYAKVVSGELRVKEEKSNFFNKKHGSVVIYVPSVLLDSLNIDNGAGEIRIDGIEARSLKIAQGAGVLSINSSKFNKTGIDGGAGKIEVFNSTLNNLDLDSGVGSIYIEALMMGFNKIECGVGRVDVKIIGSKDDYTINVEKGLGNIEIDGESQKNDVVYGKGVNNLAIDGGVGSISVDFSEK